MHYENEKFVSSTVRIINEIAYNVLANAGHQYERAEDYLIAFLHVTTQQLNAIASYIINFIPYKVYLDQYSNIRTHIQMQIVQYMINMLMQEDVRSKNIAHYSKSIKNMILFKLMNKTYVQSNY